MGIIFLAGKRVPFMKQLERMTLKELLRAWRIGALADRQDKPIGDHGVFDAPILDGHFRWI